MCWGQGGPGASLSRLMSLTLLPRKGFMDKHRPGLTWTPGPRLQRWGLAPASASLSASGPHHLRSRPTVRLRQPGVLVKVQLDVLGSLTSALLVLEGTSVETQSVCFNIENVMRASLGTCPLPPGMCPPPAAIHGARAWP